jgi:prepilin-type N-terminal cleavage/methylation domain-containing protein
MFPPLESVQPGQKTQGGVTLVELLIALVVGSIMVSAVYGAYLLVTRQYEKLSAVASLHQTGRAALGLMVRDIRQAGYLTFGSQALAGGVNVVIINRCVGPLGPSVTSTSGCGRSDQITLIYDQDTNARFRISYWVQVIGGRGQLRTTKQTCTDALMTVCANIYQNQLIADGVEDLQFVGRQAVNINANNDPVIVDVELILRTNNEYQLTANWTSPSSAAGNGRLTANDGAVREVFQQTVLVRNLAYQ